MYYQTPLQIQPRRSKMSLGIVAVVIIALVSLFLGMLWGYFLGYSNGTGTSAKASMNVSMSIDGGYVLVLPDIAIYLQITTEQSQLFGASYNLGVVENRTEAMPIPFGYPPVCNQHTYSTVGNLSGTAISLLSLVWRNNSNGVNGTYDILNTLTFTLPDANGVLGPVSFHRASVDEYNNAVPNIKAKCR